MVINRRDPVQPKEIQKFREHGTMQIKVTRCNVEEVAFQKKKTIIIKRNFLERILKIFLFKARPLSRSIRINAQCVSSNGQEQCRYYEQGEHNAHCLEGPYDFLKPVTCLTSEAGQSRIHSERGTHYLSQDDQPPNGLYNLPPAVNRDLGASPIFSLLPDLSYCPEASTGRGVWYARGLAFLYLSEAVSFESIPDPPSNII